MWDGHQFDLSHLRKMEYIYSLKPKTRLEKVSLPSDNIHYCCGYFQTTVGFYGGMLHPGRLVARKPSRCVLLQRQKYTALSRRDPASFDALNIYLAKKRFVLTGIARGSSDRRAKLLI